MKKRIISQKSLNMILAAAFLAVGILIFGSVLLMDDCFEAERQVEEKKEYCEKMSGQLWDASDYLTEEVRRFVITGDIIHMENYWEEININRSRERAVEALENEKLPQNEMKLLQNAKMDSDLLIYVEVRAMRLMADALHLDDEELEPVVRDYVLNVEDQAFSDEDKKIKAQKLLFDSQYTFEKETIMGKITRFQAAMEERLKTELSDARYRTQMVMWMQWILLAVILLLMGVILYITYYFLARPIQLYSDRLENLPKDEKEALKPSGSAEMRMFARTFNGVYAGLKRADRAKSEFVSNMSHEIRTPLNTISGYVFLLKKMPLEGRQKEYVENIERAGNSLLRIVNHILDYSKLEEKKIEIESVNFHVRDFFEQIRAMFIPAAETKGLYLRINIHPEVPEYLKGDEMKLHQILVNLISNGLKFTEKGGVKVAVQNYRTKEGRIMLCVHVDDTGCGIASDQREKIFSPFEQSDASIARKYGGTGLGLAISKEMTQLLGGKILVDSIYGRNTTFTVEIPFEYGCGQEKRKEDESWKTVSFAGKKALLAEDNVINQRMEEEILRMFGLSVWTADNGSQAVEMARKEKFDVIFMDLRMSDMDGCEAAEKIRKSAFNKETYCVALTADTEEKTRDRVLNVMDGYLTKPLMPDKLAASLERGFAGEKNLEEQNGIIEEADITDCQEDWTFEEFCGDISETVVQSGGNGQMFDAMLGQFVNRHGPEFGELKCLLKQDKKKAGERLHELKGVCAVLGLRRLADKTAKLERAVKDREEEEAEVLCLSLLCDYEKAKKWIEERGGTQAAGEEECIDETDIILVDELLTLLENADIRSVDFFEENSRVIIGQMSENKADELIQKITGYRFDEAGKIIREWKWRDNDV